MLKEGKWKFYLRGKKAEWNKSWQYLEVDQESDENRTKPSKDTHSCTEIMYYMEHLHSQPQLTYKMGLKHAESVKDTLHVFIFPEYS